MSTFSSFVFLFFFAFSSCFYIFFIIDSSCYQIRHVVFSSSSSKIEFDNVLNHRFENFVSFLFKKSEPFSFGTFGRVTFNVNNRRRFSRRSSNQRCEYARTRTQIRYEHLILGRYDEPFKM